MKQITTYALGVATGMSIMGGAAYAVSPADLRHQCAILFHMVKVPGPIRYRKPKPKPPVVETRFLQTECKPIIFDSGQPNTAFAPVDARDFPWWLGVTRNPPSHYRVDYGYLTDGGRIYPLPSTPPLPPLPPVASVPEPASWAMMVAGFGLVGGVMRRRKGVIA